MTPRRAVHWLIGALIIFFVFVLVNHRKARSERQRQTCIAHLLDIEGAKEQFALERDGVAPDQVEDVVPAYLRAWPTCPAGGLYTLGDLQVPAACSVESHTAGW